MLQLNDYMYSKKDEKVTYWNPKLSKVAFEFGPEDKVTEKTGKVKSAGEADKVATYQEVEGVEVKDASGKVIASISKHDPNDLFSAAIASLQETFPDVNPVWKLLSYASAGRNAEIRRDATPKPEMEIDEAITKVAKSFLKAGLVDTLAEGVELATAQAQKKGKLKAA